LAGAVDVDPSGPEQHLSSRITEPSKRRLRASQGFRAFHSAWRTIEGIETMNMIRKGQIRWLSKNDIAGQAEFVSRLLGIHTAA
jgi:hypothetical protein